MMTMSSNPSSNSVAGRRAPAPGDNEWCMRRFTLLEIVIASAIFAIMATVLVAFSNEVTKTWGRLRREQSRFNEVLVLDRTLDAIMTNAVDFTWRDDKNAALPTFLGEPNRMRTATLSRLNTIADGALRFVGLTVEDGALLAVYRQRPFLDWERLDEGESVAVLAEGVEAIDLQYADWVPDQGLVWESAWDTAEREALPLAILIVVHWQDGRVESWLRRTAGHGQRERLGRWRPPAVL